MAVVVELDQVVAKGLAFPEAPRWHDGALWFSDMTAQKVMKLGRDGELTKVVEVPG